jgi:hypothetical protein
MKVKVVMSGTMDTDDLTTGWSDEEEAKVEAMDGDTWAALCDAVYERYLRSWSEDWTVDVDPA